MIQATEHPKTADDLLIGILSVLAKDGKTTIRINDRSFHAAFGEALAIFRAAGGELGDLAKTFYRDVVSKTYEKLEDALISAEHYGMVKIYNPAFERLEISITPRVAEQVLADWPSGERTIIEKAAAEFHKRARSRV
jgi:hypothetical protein